MAESASGVAEVLTILLSSNSDEVPRHVLGKYLARPGAPTVSLRYASGDDWKQAHIDASQDIPDGMTAGDMNGAWETIIKDTLTELAQNGATVNLESSDYVLDLKSANEGAGFQLLVPSTDRGLTITAASDILSGRLQTFHQPHTFRADLSHQGQPSIHLRAENVTYANLESSEMALKRVYAKKSAGNDVATPTTGDTEMTH